MSKAAWRSLIALNALNFFMADVNGLGPYVGVYLQQEHWSVEAIGAALTMGGFATMIATTPFGALIDQTKWKRAIVVASALATVVASFTILLSSAFVVVAGSQIATGIAAAAIGPAVAGITLGLVKQRGYAHQLGRNESFNHAGNITAAVIAGALGYMYGLWIAFAVMAAMAFFSVVSICFIDGREISYRAARGMGKKQTQAAGFQILVKSKPLIALAITVTLFHLGNAAMLPLLGQSLVAVDKGNPAASMSSAIIIAQCTMIPVALFAAWLAERRGYWVVMLLPLIALPIRGVIAGLFIHPYAIFPIQILDGIGAGTLGVAVPGMVARILHGSGRINTGLGAIMTMQAVGVSISPGLGGIIAGTFGYSTAFLTLGALAGLALLVWLVARVMLTESAKEKLDND